MRQFFFFLVFCCFILQCAPERDNPLDPVSSSYRGTGGLSGNISGFYQPFRPLNGIFIKTVPQEIMQQTSEQGNFYLPELPKGNYQVIAFHPLFSSDTQTVEIRSVTWKWMSRS